MAEPLLPAGLRLSASMNLPVGFLVLSASGVLTLDGKPVVNAVGLARQVVDTIGVVHQHHLEALGRMKRIADALLAQAGAKADLEVDLESLPLPRNSVDA